MGQYVRGVAIQQMRNGVWTQVAAGLYGDDELTQLSLQSNGGWLPGLSVNQQYRIDFGGGVTRVMTFIDGTGGTLTFR